MKDSLRGFPHILYHFRGKYVGMCVLVLYLVLVFSALGVRWRCPVENPNDLQYMLQRHDLAKHTFVRDMICRILLWLWNGYVVVKEIHRAPCDMTSITWRCINNCTPIFTCMMHNRSCFNAFMCKYLMTMQLTASLSKIKQ